MHVCCQSRFSLTVFCLEVTSNKLGSILCCSDAVNRFELYLITYGFTTVSFMLTSQLHFICSVFPTTKQSSPHPVYTNSRIYIHLPSSCVVTCAADSSSHCGDFKVGTL